MPPLSPQRFPLRHRPATALAILALGAALAFPPLVASPAAAQGPPPPLSAADRQGTIVAIGKLLRDNYVFPEVAETTTAALAAKEKAGSYAQLSDPLAFADAVTRDLQETAKDRHLRLMFQPPRLQRPPQQPGPEREAMERQLRADNYGFREVKLLPGNVGYVRLDMFAPARFGGPTANAAMAFVGGADALIFDLRQNGGGDPSMVQLLSSYLFAEPTHLNDLYWRRDDTRNQFWTLPWVPANTLPEVPVYVLTSGLTFSGGEEFTNNLKVLKRATIVGETTGGGANPGQGFDVDERFTIFVPTGRAINPTTNGNWEGTGVEPDIEVAAKDALLTAQAAALDTLAAKAGDEPERQGRYRFARTLIEAQLHPFTPDPARLGDYAGDFGPRRVVLEDGSLVYQREGRPKVRLLPVARDTFSLEGRDDVLANFERGGDGKATRIVLQFSDGHREESPRAQ